MRTSPHAMRLPRARRAPVLAVAVLALLTPLVACGDDGGDDRASPTTTAPATTATTEPEDGDPTSTTEAPTTTGAGEDGPPTTVAGDDATVLTAEEAQAQIVALLAEARHTVASAAQSGALVFEPTLAALNRTFTGQAASSFLSGLQQAGLPALNPSPAEVRVSGVEVTSTGGGCAAGTAEVVGIVGDTGMIRVPVDVVQPYYFRLVPAPEGATSPAWRLAFLSFSTDGVPLAEATCD